MLNRGVIYLFNTIILYVVSMLAQVKAVFYRGSIIKESFCPFYSDVDTVLVLKDPKDKDYYEYLKGFFGVFGRIKNINPFWSDYWQSVFFCSEFEILKKFWYFFYDIPNWKLLWGKRDELFFWLRDDFPDGNKGLTLIAGYNRLLFWYNLAFEKFSKSERLSYSIFQKAELFGKRTNAFLGFRNKYFNFEEYKKQAPACDVGPFDFPFDFDDRGQIEKLTESFYLIKKIAALLLKENLDTSAVLYREAVSDKQNKFNLIDFEKNIELPDIESIFAVSGERVYLIVKDDVDESGVKKIISVSRKLFLITGLTPVVYPSCAFPLLFTPFAKQSIYNPSDKDLYRDTMFLRQHSIYRAVYLRNYLKMVFQSDDYHEKLNEIFYRFLQTALILKKGYFCLTRQGIIEECKRDDLFKDFNEEFKAILEYSPCSLNKISSRLLFSVNMRLSKDLLDSVKA